MVDASQPKMEYRNLGNSGVKVSVIGFGNFLNSDDPKNLEKNIEIIKRAWSLGINFFDTAEIYGNGEAEIQLGLALKELKAPRDQLVISTKLFWGYKSEKEITPNDIGLSRQHIIQGLKKSLTRLQLDYVDIVYAHRFDDQVSLEETCQAFDWCIKQGLALYWGTSMWSAANIFEAIAICNKFNLTPPIVEQPEYNMLSREKLESEYVRLFDLYGYGSTIFFPLASGILSGKYNDGIPNDSRMTTFQHHDRIQFYFSKFFGEGKKEATIAKLKKIAELSKSYNISMVQLAFAWVLKNKDVSSALTSATKIFQLEESVSAVQLYQNLKPELFEKLEEILQNKPDSGYNYRTFKPNPSRR